MTVSEDSEDFWVERLADGREKLHLRAKATFKLFRGTTAPESGEAKIYFTEKYGPWPVPAQIRINGSVDDVVFVNGVTAGTGAFDYSVTISPNTPLVIEVMNVIQGACSISCTITVSLKGK